MRVEVLRVEALVLRVETMRVEVLRVEALVLALRFWR